MTDEQIQALLMNRYTALPEKDKEAVREIFHDEKAGRVIRKFIGGKIANNFKLRKPLSMQEGDRVTQQPTTVQAPGYIGGHNPEATPQQTIADDKPMDAKDGDYIINAAAADFAGKQDIQTMINTAITSLQEKGVDLRFGNPKMNIDETVKLLVSQNEVYIPKEIAKEIGYDRLGKINNRGKEHTRKIQQETDKPTGAYQGGFIKKALGEEVKANGVQPVGFVEDTVGFIEDKVLPLFGIGGQGDLPSELRKSPPINPKSKVPPQDKIIEAPTQESFVSKPDPFYKLVRGAVKVAEGDLKTEGYIPTVGNKGKVAVARSGVTIGQGVDLGAHTADSLKKMGYPESLINKFMPYFGLRKQAALNALNKNKKNNNPLTLTTEEAELATELMIKHKIKEYNKIGKYKKFRNLEDQRLNALLIAEHYGGRLSNYNIFRDTLLKGNYTNLKEAYKLGVHNRLPKQNHQRNTANRLFEWYNYIDVRPVLREDMKNYSKEIQIPKKQFTVPDTDSKGEPVERIGI